jgi:hypothetical protein
MAAPYQKQKSTGSTAPIDIALQHNYITPIASQPR